MVDCLHICVFYGFVLQAQELKMCIDCHSYHWWRVRLNSQIPFLWIVQYYPLHLYSRLCVCVCCYKSFVCIRHAVLPETTRVCAPRHSGLGSGVSGLASPSSSLSTPDRVTKRRMVMGRSPRLGRRGDVETSHQKVGVRSSEVNIVMLHIPSSHSITLFTSFSLPFTTINH